MERFTLAQAAAWTHGEARGEAALTAVTTDSRQIPPEALFLPIKGERFDAHDFIGKAIENGAAAVMSHRENEEYPVPALYVENTSQALLDLAGGYRMMCGGKVVGVTGSVGKTTTKELLYAVLSQGFRAQKTEGNLNNEIGLPLTLMRMTRDTEVLVAEMGMNHFGELSHMTAAARPNLAVITNIGTSHIEFLGSREGICKAKLEILEGLREGGTAVLCGDEPLLWDKRGSLGCKVVTYGIENSDCDLIAHLHSDGTFDIVNNGLAAAHLSVGEKFTAKLSIPGKHNVLNALAAAAVGLLLGETPALIAQGLVSYQASGMRQNIYEQDGYHIYADCYNASPDAMEATLSVLGGMAGGRPPVCGSRLDARAWRLRRGRSSPCRSCGGAVRGRPVCLRSGCSGHGSPVPGRRAWSMRMRSTIRPHLSRHCARTRKRETRCCSRAAAAMRMERALAMFLGEEVEA